MIIGDLIAKQQAGKPLTEAEAAYYIRNYPPALAAFMIENNPGSVNYTLRKLGYSHLNFQPDQAALVRQMQIFLERGNAADWTQVAKNFQINTTGLSPSFVSELQKQFS